jgi:endonuclease/exonuclease/phosphatase family metal-dependent hydrolase
MKPTSPSVRFFAFEHIYRKPSSGSTAHGLLLGVLVSLVAAIGCSDPPTVRNSTQGAGGGGFGGSGSGGNGTGGDGGQVIPNDPKALRVLNWNVHNLENDKDDSGAPGETIVTTAEYTAHRQAVGIVLKDMDADIVVLTEVENKAVLDDLNNTELSGRYIASSLIEGNDYRGVDIGVLSKYPIDSVVTHKQEPFTLVGTQGPNYYFSRDCPEIHIQFNGRKMVFLGTHLKAKSNDDPIKRLAEAQRTRAIADELAKADPTRAIAILGDFNDTPGSPPYLAVVGEAPTQFTDVSLSIPLADRWTYEYQGQKELIDYQIVNPVLAPMVDVKSVIIRHAQNVTVASDHAPVIATYMVN